MFRSCLNTLRSRSRVAFFFTPSCKRRLLTECVLCCNSTLSSRCKGYPREAYNNFWAQLSRNPSVSLPKEITWSGFDYAARTFIAILYSLFDKSRCILPSRAGKESLGQPQKLAANNPLHVWKRSDFLAPSLTLRRHLSLLSEFYWLL